jgi:hypothetical protein
MNNFFDSKIIPPLMQCPDKIPSTFIDNSIHSHSSGCPAAAARSSLFKWNIRSIARSLIPTGLCSGQLPLEFNGGQQQHVRHDSLGSPKPGSCPSSANICWTEAKRDPFTLFYRLLERLLTISHLTLPWLSAILVISLNDISAAAIIRSGRIGKCPIRICRSRRRYPLA